MDEKVVIAVLAGTTREKRRSFQAAKWVESFGQNLPNVEIIFVDPKDFNFPNDGDDPEVKDRRYTDIITRADGLLIVTPEYNHHIPGSLKRMLDSEDTIYFHKAASIIGVSNGDWGGTRAVESLIPVLKAFGLAVTRNSAYFSHIDTTFHEDGSMNTEMIEKYNKSVGGVYNELLWLTRALKWGRNNLPSA
ncbi:MAG TPA: NAD(P)H-dependent oxidoreductase [Patescibacteria group bacterium]|nr:NAD(P)H-dependent oxidoreductase [Patescibacteria group bacterium]